MKKHNRKSKRNWKW